MKIRTAIFVAALVAWGSQPAFATTLVRMSLEQLSQAATAIVRARVVSQESRWNEDHTRIFTFTTVAIDESLKGQPPSTVVIRQPGGTVGNIHVRVAGTVAFRPQAEYVLFLEPSGVRPAQYLLVGMVQGAYRIHRNPATHQERLLLPLGRLYRAGATAAGAAPGGNVPYPEFRGLVSETVRTPIIVPHGISVPLTIQSTEFRGAGRLRVLARTNLDLFPNAGLVIPAGSTVEGTATLVGGMWRIRWDEILVRGARAQISGASEEPAGSLRGRILVVEVK